MALPLALSPATLPAQGSPFGRAEFASRSGLRQSRACFQGWISNHRVHGGHRADAASEDSIKKYSDTSIFVTGQAESGGLILDIGSYYRRHELVQKADDEAGCGQVGFWEADEFEQHFDTGDDYLGSRFHHGSPFRRAVEEGVLDPKRTVQIGIRGSLNMPDFWKFSHDSGMRVVYMEELFERGVREIIEEARQIVGEGRTYISFDVAWIPLSLPEPELPRWEAFPRSRLSIC